MSKAEERSKEIIQAALDYANNLDDIKPTDEFRRNLCISLGQSFMKGAEWADSHQAEKDNELSWEDMRELYIIFAEVDTEIEICQTDIKAETLGYYQEVLKRFKDFKETKEK